MKPSRTLYRRRIVIPETSIENGAGSASTRSPDMKRVTRDLATIAVAHEKQDGRLKVRQREQLRRAVARAGRALGWASEAPFRSDPVGDLGKEIVKLARKGTRRMKRDLRQEFSDKEVEIEQLEGVLARVKELANDPAALPAKVTYQRTARHSVHGLVTKTETLELETVKDARTAAKKMGKRIERWTRYRDQMMEKLERETEVLRATSDNLPDFVDRARPVLGEVLATMH